MEFPNGDFARASGLWVEAKRPVSSVLSNLVSAALVIGRASIHRPVSRSPDPDRCAVPRAGPLERSRARTCGCLWTAARPVTSALQPDRGDPRAAHRPRNPPPTGLALEPMLPGRIFLTYSRQIPMTR